MFHAVVPEEYAMFLGYLLDPLHHELGDLFEMTKKLVSNVDTYLFPVFTF